MKRYLKSNCVSAALDLSDYQQLSSTLHDGGDTYALFRKRGDGKTSWAAVKYSNGDLNLDDAFEITYEQARGIAPISDAGDLGRKVGKMIFGSTENYHLYRNKKNENKYVEVKRTPDGHTWFRQFMFWNTDRGPVKNYYTSKSNKGRYHRVRLDWLEQLLEDYEIVESVEDGIKNDFSYAGSPENPNDIVSSEDSKAWPEDLTYDDYDEGDQIIEVFIDVVGDLNLFEEPSSQGGVGTDYFYDGDGGDIVGEIDMQEEKEQLEDLYWSSTSKADFKEKVKLWMKNLCGLN